jgi:hypothetical protein
MKCGNALAAETYPATAVSAPISQPAPMNRPVHQEQYPMSAPQTFYPAPPSILAPLSIWGPFAGYGTRRRHIGWLLDGSGGRVEDLTQRIHLKFGQRQIPGVMVQPKTLVARGVFVERRPYIILKRGLVSLALNIFQFGQDLFISLASYLKPPISNFRVIIASIMTLIWVFSSFMLPALVYSSASSALGGFSLLGGGFGARSAAPFGSLLTLLCVIGPLASINNFVLLIFFFYSVYKWFTERDFWAGLRSAPNEFNEDDLMALEKSVEQTVRIALDEIGLNSNDLKPVEGTLGRRLI